MILRVHRKYKLFLLATILLLGVVVFIRISDAFNLKEICTMPEGVIGESALLAAPLGENIFNFAGNNFLDSVVANKKVINAKLDFDFPDEMKIILNDIKPLALVRSNCTFFVLDELGYLSEFESRPTSFNFPIITGVGKCRLYAPAGNDRLQLLTGQLKTLCAEDNDFYLAISTIDLSSPDYTLVKMDGLKPSLKMFAGDLSKNMEYLKTFLLEFNPDLSQIKLLDLRLTGQVIAVEK